MRPVETETTDTTYAGVPSRDIGELPTETGLELLPDGVAVQRHRSYWELAPDERAAVMMGARLVIDILGEAVPPIRPALMVPPDVSPETVYAMVDEAIDISVGTSIVEVLAGVGIERDLATVRSWSRVDRDSVALWLRTIVDDDPDPEPDVLELSDADRAKLPRKEAAADG